MWNTAILPSFWHCFINISSRTILITSIFLDLKSTYQYLQDDIGIKWVGLRLGTFNFRCVHYFAFGHASRQMGSIWPNRPQFLLYEGKVWRVKWTNKWFGSFGLVGCVLFVTRRLKEGVIWSHEWLKSSMPPTWDGWLILDRVIDAPV